MSRGSFCLSSCPAPSIFFVTGLPWKEAEKDQGKKGCIPVFAGAILFFCVNLACIFLFPWKGAMTPAYLYRTDLYTDDQVEQLGLGIMLFNDIRHSLFGVPETAMPEIGQAQEEEEEPEETYEPNMLDVDFEALEASASSEEEKWLSSYFGSLQPVRQNAYTGMFEGYNVIFITAEGFSGYMIDPELTPVLYRLSTEGFVFENFYSPLHFTSTSGGEFQNLTGLYPKAGFPVSLTESGERGTWLPFTLANALQEDGYTSIGYHFNQNMYGRELSHPNLGYEWRQTDKCGRPVTKETDESGHAFWPQSDAYMVEQTFDDYTEKEPFNVYYLTISMHLPYGYDSNEMSRRNWEKVADLPYSDKTKAYIASGLELEKGLAELVDRLEEAGIADHTLLVMAPDHIPYSDLDILEELAGREFGSDSVETLDESDVDTDVYRNTWILWSASMEEPVKVDKVCSQVDILPTLLNLLGAEYDSRMLAGTDALSDREGTGGLFLPVLDLRSGILQQVYAGVPARSGRQHDGGGKGCVCGEDKRDRELQAPPRGADRGYGLLPEGRAVGRPGGKKAKRLLLTNVQKALCLFCFLFGRRRHIPKRIGDPQVLPFKNAKCVVGQDLHPLHVGEGADEDIHLAKIRLVVCESGDEDVADPDRDAQRIQEPGHGKDIVIPAPGQPDMSGRIHHLQVKEHKVCVLHQRKEAAVKRFLPRKGRPGCVNGRVDAFFFCLPEQLRQKSGLQKGFPAAYGDPALFAPVGAVPERLPEKLIGSLSHGMVRGGGPGVRVVTEAAPQGTALEKDDETDARPVHGAEALRGVDKAGGRGLAVPLQEERICGMLHVEHTSCIGLYGLVAGSGDDIHLLLPGEVDEFHRVAGDSDGKVGVLLLLRVLHGVDELLHAEHIDIQMVRALAEVAVQDEDEIADPLLLCVAQGIRVDGLGVGNAVQRPLIGKFGQGIQGGEEPASLCAVTGVGAGRQRFACPAPVRQGAGSLAVHDIGCDGEDGCGRLGIPVGVVLPDLLHKGFQKPDRNVVRPVVVVAVPGEIPCCLIVRHNAVPRPGWSGLSHIGWRLRSPPRGRSRRSRWRRSAARPCR